MKKSELFFSFLLIPIDFLMLVLGTAVAYELRNNSFFGILDLAPASYDFSVNQYITWAIIFSLSGLIVFRLFGLYNLRSTRGSLQEAYRVFGAVSAVVMGIILIMFLNRKLFSSRIVIITAWSAAIFLASFGRMLIRIAQRTALQYGYGVHRLVIVGNSGIGTRLCKEFNRPANLAFKVVAHIKDSHNATRQIKKIKERRGVDEILQCDPNIKQRDLDSLYAYADDNHLVFKFVPNLFEAQATNVDVMAVNGIPVLEIKKTSLDGWGRITKRVADVVISALVLLLTWPMMLLISLVIKLDSEGTVFFSKFKGKKMMRIGQYGKPFHYFKFRSMRQDSHLERYTKLAGKNTRSGSPLVKIKDDPRITRVGRFIRRFSLDEWPEFWLVFIGRMSLVGPRPHLPEEVERYKKHHRKVLNIKPGITGLAQISGRSDLDFEEEVRLDSYYIENWSFKQDIWVLLHTPKAVLKKRQDI